LNTLATIHFNHPDWCLPKLAPNHFVFESKALGHPLIPGAERINNDFLVAENTLISLVTGSNMAGKSTFLRSIGINMVLAQMGSPVCAKNFTISPVRLMTSMRISDNLAENTSTFYAELKKLKTIIEAVNNREKVFVLLDEILRGTNSHDRHTGSAAFITQLIRHHAFAVIATHDLELADLKKAFPQSLENYHFDVQVKGEELYFDYKLKEGVCHSLNASLLMKKIGIELEG
jgi:DNA mismatch repair ATPase MutS